MISLKQSVTSFCVETERDNTEPETRLCFRSADALLLTHFISQNAFPHPGEQWPRPLDPTHLQKQIINEK